MNTNQTQGREEAGGQLAKRLAGYAESPDVIVLALPHGGLPIGGVVASLLHKPFDVLLMENIPAPGGEGQSLGAVTTGGVRVLNSALIDRLHLSRAEVNAAVLDGCQKIARHEKKHGAQRAHQEIADRTVILVDDGMTPCATIHDAIHLLRRQHADHVIVALAVGCSHTVCDLRFEADAVVALTEPSDDGTHETEIRVTEWHDSCVPDPKLRDNSLPTPSP